jgi:hypothetical protein
MVTETVRLDINCHKFCSDFAVQYIAEIYYKQYASFTDIYNLDAFIQ